MNQVKEECKSYLNNGILLILLGIMYLLVSSYMYFNGTNTTMHEYITYLVALIAFYSIGTAIYGMVKYKRNTEPIIKGIKITNFANALTSLVLTQVVLLDTFSGRIRFSYKWIYWYGSKLNNNVIRTIYDIRNKKRDV